MSVAGLERRLRKLEARRREPGTIYFAWGRSADELDAILADAFKNGELGPDDPNVCVQCEDGPVPTSGWKVYRQLSKEEKDVLFSRIEQIAGDLQYNKTLPEHQVRQMTDEQLLPIALGRSVPISS